MQPIVQILPAREGFSPQSFGAVSLSVRDFTLHSRYRHDIHILGAVDAPPYEGFHYHALPVRRHWYEPNTRAYVRAIKTKLTQLNPALIEIHNRPVLALKIAAITAAPIALHLHNDPQEMKAAKTPAQRRALLGNVAAIYCISHWVRARFLDGLSADAAQKVHTVHSGIAIPPAPNHKDNKIVFIGRMTPNKGGVEYAQALASILPQQPDWHGYVIGGRRHSVSATLSAYEKQVAAIMEPLGESAHVEGFYPFEQTQAMLARAAIVVIPSLWQEPFGRIGIEALSHGCAVVTSGSGGLREIVEGAGIILQETTGDTIAKALHALIRDDTQRSELQQRAYAKAAEFEIQSCTDRLDDVRMSLLKEEKDRYAA